VKSPVGTLDFTIKHHRDWWIPSADWSHLPRHVGLIWSYYCVVILNDFGVVKLFSPHQLEFHGEETMQLFGRDVFVHKFQLHESGAWVGEAQRFFPGDLGRSSVASMARSMVQGSRKNSSFLDNLSSQSGFV